MMDPANEEDKNTAETESNTLQDSTIQSVEEQNIVTSSNEPVLKKRMASNWLKSYKKVSVALILLIVVGIAIGVFFLTRNHKTTQTISKTSAITSPSNSPTKSTADNSTQKTTQQSAPVNIPETYSPSSGYALATETYSPPADSISYNSNNYQVRAADSSLITSRILVYTHQTGIYTGLIDAQIDLYDTGSQKNYVLVPGGSSSAAIDNNSPILLGNNKMLFVQTTKSSTSESSQLELMDLETGDISKVSLPFSDITTLDAAAVAPDGIYVAYPMNNSILVLDTQTNTTKNYPVSMVGSTISGSTSYEQMAWSADSSTIYYANQYFITHQTPQSAAAFQPNNIFALSLASSKSTQLTNDSSGHDTLQVYGSNLYFKQFSSIYSSVEAYINLASSSTETTVLPDSSDFVWPILPNADGTEYVVVPGNNTSISLINFQGQTVQNIYTNMSASGQLVSQYNSSEVIGWIDQQTLLLAEQHSTGTAYDIYTYNIQTNKVTLVLKSI